MEEKRQWRERTKHATLTWQTARGQWWFSMVMVVVCADIVPQVGGTAGHAEDRGTEEARAERACVRGRRMRRKRRSQVEEVCRELRKWTKVLRVSISFNYTPCRYCHNKQWLQAVLAIVCVYTFVYLTMLSKSLTAVITIIIQRKKFDKKKNI